MTMASLKRARDEFFETRVTGRPEMWAAVRILCEMVEEGDVESAQAILDAAGGTCPIGTLWGNKGGCYDEFGERYVVPVWCVGVPYGVRRDGTDGDGDEHADADEVEKVGRGNEDDLLEDEIRIFSRESKGKARALMDQGAVKGEALKVKVRFSHTARDVTVTIGDQDKVDLLVQRAKSAGSVSLFKDQVMICQLIMMLDTKQHSSSSFPSWPPTS